VMNSLLLRETFLNCVSLVSFSIRLILIVCSRPVGGSFTVELAGNRGVTSLSYDGQYTSEWSDGQSHPEDYNEPTCIVSPNSEYGSPMV
jgi:hypothetical protein